MWGMSRRVESNAGCMYGRFSMRAVMGRFSTLVTRPCRTVNTTDPPYSRVSGAPDGLEISIGPITTEAACLS